CSSQGPKPGLNGGARASRVRRSTPEPAMRLALAALLLAALPASALAQTPPTWPVKLPSSGGEVIIPSQGFQQAYDEIRFAPARRASDTLYVSGIIAGPREGEATDAAAFEVQIRRAFQILDRTLKASGVTFDDVVMINSFHVWEGPNFKGARDEQ